MNDSSARARAGLLRRLAAGLAGLALLGSACSSDSSSNAAPGTTGGTPAANGSCAKSQLEILFPRMYSAFTGGPQKFQVPAVVNSIDPAALQWSAADASMVSLQPTEDGVMITVQKPGTTTIVASAGGLCGTALLTVTQATQDDWMVGSMRYNEGIVLRPGMGGLGGRGDAGAAAREAACTNCHGDSATMGPFKTVAHTPQQTAGFSDAELIDIMTKGVIPAGGYFDDTIVSRQQWSNFHRWDMTPEEAKGLVVFLRGLTPAPQKGMRGDFGGGFNRPDGGFGGRGDGGRGDGGRREGGGGPGDGDGGVPPAPPAP